MFNQKKRGSSQTLLALALSISLMLADRQMHRLEELKVALKTIMQPVIYAVDVPMETAQNTINFYQRQSALVKENRELKVELLSQQARLQILANLRDENARLRKLLQSSPRSHDQLQVAEIINVDTKPYTQQFILDKGAEHGAHLGQAVIDAHGVMGQVIEVSKYQSRVMLVTDLNHSIPVENRRNGVRAIANGAGGTLAELLHIPNTADFKVGDELISSGMGGRFPKGYPVGRISEVKKEEGEPFLKIVIEPTAHLLKTRQVLLVWPDGVPMPKKETKKNG